MSLDRRLHSLEDGSRRRAVGELGEFFASLADREVACLISGSQRRERGLQIREEERDALALAEGVEQILARAVVPTAGAERVREVLADTGVFERGGIRPHLEELRKYSDRREDSQ